MTDKLERFLRRRHVEAIHRETIEVNVPKVVGQMDDDQMLRVIVACLENYGGSVADIRDLVNHEDWNDL